MIEETSTSEIYTGPAILCKGLVKSFPGKEVLRGIDFEVRSGTIFGYIGSNGAGKTTTVKILTGMLGGYAGEVSVAGIDVQGNPQEVKRRIGYVPEHSILYDGLTAWEYLQLIGRLRSMEEALIEHRAHELLQVFDLFERAHSRLMTFSKGMRQKVMLCCALLHDPDVLFLDEPMAGLDVESTIFLKDLITSLASRGRTIFYCSHIMDVVERVCDRIVILNDGLVAADGTFLELAKRKGEESLEGLFTSLTGRRSSDARVAQVLDALDS
ncbi:MAG: ABC-2 type transport system ATP-binding protein [Planctomycetota bacterium]|jgi:ABC-2 type transport system ATP-binding protein